MFELNNTNPNEGSTISANSAITVTGSNPTNILNAQVMPTVYQSLQRFAADPNLSEKLKLAFGSDYNVQTAQTIVDNWLIGDFSTIPPIELVERGDIAGANGVFAAATNKIYLSKDILTGETANTAAVEDVILEEIGHSIDALVNAVDAPGDEGEIFADVVQGKTLAATDWANLKAEDDSTTINIDGKQYLAEMNSFAIKGSIGSYYYRSDNASMRTALGAATSNEFQVPNGWRQNFEGGAIFHSGAGSYTVRGSLGNYYLNNLGGEKSQLGLPTGNEFQVSNGWRQNFERGYVNWLHTGSGTFTLNSSPTPDRLNQLGSKSSLTIDEIQEYRGLVTQRPQSERAGLYRTLQYKVPYFNQRDNASTEGGQRIGDVMCNVTSLASCLTTLGVKNPNSSKQFEDVLEDRLRANPSRYPSSQGTNARYWWDNLSKLAQELGVASSGTQQMQGFSSTNTTFFQNFVRNNWESALQQGKAIMAGVYTTQPGHIVKVIDIDWNRGGIVVDDPYGQAQNSSINDYKRFNYTGTQNTTSRGSVNTQQGQNENGIGNDNFWSWSYCAEVFGDTWYLRLG